ncbi:hypothetical protein DAI22_02g102700 [Oryza sativa Japonica Group]|nr:hypothetical protein DAI22_02g102700 [Oryza sativa Japonica Group]
MCLEGARWSSDMNPSMEFVRLPASSLVRLEFRILSNISSSLYFYVFYSPFKFLAQLRFAFGDLQLCTFIYFLQIIASQAAAYFSTEF